MPDSQVNSLLMAAVSTMQHVILVRITQVTRMAGILWMAPVLQKVENPTVADILGPDDQMEKETAKAGMPVPVLTGRLAVKELHPTVL
jgi:hypothetical protein